MKFRTDFVTNSSSSSFIVLALKTDARMKIFNIEHIEEEDVDNNYALAEHLFQDSNLEAFINDGYLEWLGYNLTEDDLRKKTLNTLEIEMIDNLNKTYNLNLSIDDVFFDFGEIYN